MNYIGPIISAGVSALLAKKMYEKMRGIDMGEVEGDPTLQLLGGEEARVRVTKPQDNSPWETESKSIYTWADDITRRMWRDKSYLRNNPYAVGREEDLKDIFACLGTEKSPSNVLVTGSAGIGKSILISEIARRILRGDVPEHLKGRHLYVISDGVNGDELQKMIKHSAGKAIFIFDECHNTFEAMSFSFSAGITTQGERLRNHMTEKQPVPFIFLTDRPPYNLLEGDKALIRRRFHFVLKEIPYEAAVTVAKSENLPELLGAKCGRALRFAPGFIELATKLSMAFMPKETLPGKIYRILEPAVMRFVADAPPGEGDDPLEIPLEALYTWVESHKQIKREEVEEGLAHVEAMLKCPIPPHEPLIRYTRNLSLEKLDPALKREELMKRVVSIMETREGNNVLIKAPAGTGKTAFAEGLALALREGKFPGMENKQVLVLNLAELQQDRALTAFIKSAERYKEHYFLVVDEAQRLSLPMTTPSSGSSPESMMNSVAHSSSFMENLKEAWGRGNIPTLLITTPREADELIRSDAALQRRFDIRELTPFSVRDVIDIVKVKATTKILPQYGENLQIEAGKEEEVVSTIAYLAKAYMPEESHISSSVKLMHRIAHKLSKTGTDTITKEAVFNICEYEFMATRAELEEKLREEKAIDHPLTRVIPADSFLGRHSINLTKEALLEKIPRYTFSKTREEVLNQMIKILSKPHCNNVILEGAAGTGKTSLAKELAARIAEGNVPSSLEKKPVLEIKGSELADPQKFSLFLHDVEKYKRQFILFVDEAHLLAPFFEQLKPLLADGTLSLVGATTEKIFHGDKALRDRFTSFSLPKLKKEEALQMLQGSRKEMEKDLQKSLNIEKVTITDEALKESLKKSDARHWPRSAVQLIEEGAVAFAFRANRANNVQGIQEIALRAMDILKPSAKQGGKGGSWSYLKHFSVGFFKGLGEAVSKVAIPLLTIVGAFIVRAAMAI